LDTRIQRFSKGRFSRKHSMKPARGLAEASRAQPGGAGEEGGPQSSLAGRIEGGGGYGSRETRRKLAAALDAPVWALEDEAGR
jgi:hypothetical protein